MSGAADGGLDSTVRVELSGGIASVTLNRPDRLNSFNVEMHQALRAALESLAVDESCRVILLTGAGRGFCAGQDLSDRTVAPGAERPDLSQAIESHYNPLIRLLRSMPKPVIAVVNGVAAGAGANIALACDIVLAGRSATFVQAFARIGLVPDSGGTWVLPRLIGDARARAIALLAEPVNAEQAESWGMIWKAVDDNLLHHEAMKLAERFAQAPTYGLSLIKRAFLVSSTNDLDTQLDLERDLQQAAGYSPDYAEGVAAFMDKRHPKFTGRKD